jgi:DNA-binding Lrp family transcriptional regulator
METAYVLVSCDLGFEVDIIQELKSIDSVMEVQGAYGAYDIIAKIENPNREKLREIIISNIRKLKHVHSTLTLMGIPGQAWREN